MRAVDARLRVSPGSPLAGRWMLGSRLVWGLHCGQVDARLWVSPGSPLAGRRMLGSGLAWGLYSRGGLEGDTGLRVSPGSPLEGGRTPGSGLAGVSTCGQVDAWNRTPGSRLAWGLYSQAGGCLAEPDFAEWVCLWQGLSWITGGSW